MDKCIHHWDLGASCKGVVHAKCRKCLAENDYCNTPVFKSGTFGNKNKVAPVTVTTASKTLD